MTPSTSGIPRTGTGTPAVVLKFDPNVMHHGGLGAIRSLGRFGVPVYGVHESRWAPAANSRYLRGRWLWRPSQADADRVRAGLLRLAGEIGQPAVLIPTDDAGAIFLAEHGDGLRSSFLFPAPPRDLPRRLAGKYSMYELCRELDVPCPRAAMPRSPDEAREFAAWAGFPLIAKLSTPWHRGGGRLRSTSIVSDLAELEDVRRACDEERAGLMLQEFIPGGRGHDWFFHGYCDADSVCRPAFTGIKDRSYPPHAGLTSYGRSASNQRLRDEVTRLLARLSYRGIVDLDLRWDARDGQYKLVDFNPRLGAQFRLFRDAAGLDVVLAQYLDLTGAGVADREQVSGRAFLVENYDPISALGYWRGGDLGLRSWLASLREVDETAWFARDDLWPFGLMLPADGLARRDPPLRGPPAPHHRQRAQIPAGPRGPVPHPRPGPAGHRPAIPRRGGVNPHSRTPPPDHVAPRSHVRRGGTTGMKDPVDVAIVGAGPYGLSLAAHLRRAGISYRQFGLPMHLWQAAMPRGMFLKSQGFASNLSDPDGTHTLAAFCKATSRRCRARGIPVRRVISRPADRLRGFPQIPGREGGHAAG